MNSETLWFIISMSGALIMICFGIIGFFLNRLISDVKSALTQTSENKGKIELVEQQQLNDIKRIEERTQVELTALTKNVGELSHNVNVLVVALAKKGINAEDEK